MCIVKHKTAGTVQVIPVPATSILTIINADASLNGKSAVIYDMQGRVRLRFTISALLAIPVRDWVSGIYSLHLPDGTVQRLVKE